MANKRKIPDTRIVGWEGNINGISSDSSLQEKLKHTYTLKVRQGIDDLIGVTDENGEFIGCSIVRDLEEYLKHKSYYDALINLKNEEYIKLLLEKEEYGKVIEIDLALSHNPTFDGPSEPKSIEELHPMESYRMVFLDFNTPEKERLHIYNSNGKFEASVNAKVFDEALKKEASSKFENTEISYYEFNDYRTGKKFQSNCISHLIDQIVRANDEDQYVRWSLENWTKEDWEKHRVTKKIVNMENLRNQDVIDHDIKAVKTQRVAIDEVIQSVKVLVVGSGMAEKTLALRKLQEAKMWLGQVLAELGAETPYPHGDNPNNSIVSPTADTYKANQISDAAIGEKPKYPLVSVHFTIKDQSFESLEVLLSKLVTTWQPTFIFDYPTKVVHSFMPLELVKEKGYSTELYDRLLNPYFGNQECLFREGDLQRSRENVLSRVKEAGGYAIFIGDIKEGVQEEFDLARELGVQILHLPHIDTYHIL